MSNEELEQCYQTGAVEPPKGKSALVALLLIAVILLAGLCAILGAINRRLFVALGSQQASRLAVETVDTTEAKSSGVVSAQLEGEPVTELYQNYYDLPAGMYISEASQGQGLRPGDILLSVAGQSITSQEEFSAALARFRSGDRVEVVILREEQQITLTLTVEVEE